MKMRPVVLVASILMMGLSSIPAFGQAATVSERERIVSYDAADLNPAEPGYEWEGATLLQNIQVIDGLGNPPQTGLDVLVAEGKIQAIGESGSLDVPADARIIEGVGLTILPGLIDAHIHLSSGWRGPNDNGNRPVHVKWQVLNFLYAGREHLRYPKHPLRLHQRQNRRSRVLDAPVEELSTRRRATAGAPVAQLDRAAQRMTPLRPKVRATAGEASCRSRYANRSRTR